MNVIKYFIILTFFSVLSVITCCAQETSKCDGMSYIARAISKEYLGESLAIKWCFPDNIMVDGKISPTYAFYKANSDIFAIKKSNITEEELLEADKIFREKAGKISQKLSGFPKITFTVITGDENNKTYAYTRNTFYDNMMKSLLGKTANNIIIEERTKEQYDAILPSNSDAISYYVLNNTLFVLKLEDAKDRLNKQFGFKTVFFDMLVPSLKNIISFTEQVEQYADNLLKEHRKTQMGEVLKDYFKNPMNTIAFFEIQESLRNSFKPFGYSGKLI